MGRPVESLTLSAHPDTAKRVAGVLDDVLAATRCAKHALTVDDAVEAGTFAVSDAVFG